MYIRDIHVDVQNLRGVCKIFIGVEAVETPIQVLRGVENGQKIFKGGGGVGCHHMQQLVNMYDHAMR